MNVRFKGYKHMAHFHLGNLDTAVDELLIRLERLERKGPFMAAVWIQAESEDANLSQIDTGEADEIYGTGVIRFVPKLASVTGLTGGVTVWCSRKPVIILGVLVGNTNLAIDNT